MYSNTGCSLYFQIWVQLRTLESIDYISWVAFGTEVVMIDSKKYARATCKGDSFTLTVCK